MRFSTLLLTASCVVFSSAAALASKDDMPKWGPQVEVEAKASSSGRRLIIPKFMMPFYQTDDSMLFVDIRTRQDNRDSDEYNIGLGYRKILDDAFLGEQWLVGGYGFFDSLRSKHENEFRQITLGAEAMSESFDIRANMYLPENDAQRTNDASIEVTGNNIYMVGGQEKPLKGYDAEVGFKLPVSWADMRVYGGGYYFDENDDNGYEEIAGPRGRIEFTLSDQHVDFLPVDGMEVSLGFEAQNDDVRGSQELALLEVKIPLGFAGKTRCNHCLSAVERRMNEFIERDVDIVTGGENRREQASYNGTAISEYVTVDAGDDVDATINGAGSGAFILADGTAGTLTPDASISIAGKTLQGGGQTLTFTGAESGNTASYTFGGTAPTFDAAASGFTMAGGSTLRNVTIQDAAGDAIDIPTGGAVTIDGVTINNSTGNAINYDPVVYIESASLNVQNTTISGAVDGIYYDFQNAAEYSVSFDNVSISGATQEGIEIDVWSQIQTLSMNDVTITSPGGDGVLIYRSNGGYLPNFSVNNVTVTGAGDDAFHLEGVFGTLSGSGNTLTGSTDNACETTSVSFTGSFTYNTSLSCP